MLELMLLVVVLLLAAVICFLLYQLYKIKYTGNKPNSMFVPEIEGIDYTEKDLRFSSKLDDIDSKISSLEGKLKEQERNVERLVRALSSE
jgi:predicted RNase H-like nuclease (RuvC/YqgF family)